MIDHGKMSNRMNSEYSDNPYTGRSVSPSASTNSNVGGTAGAAQSNSGAQETQPNKSDSAVSPAASGNSAGAASNYSNVWNWNNPSSSMSPAASGNKTGMVQGAQTGANPSMVSPAASGSKTGMVQGAQTGSNPSMVSPAASGSKTGMVQGAQTGSNPSMVSPAASGSNPSMVSPAASVKSGRSVMGSYADAQGCTPNRSPFPAVTPDAMAYVPFQQFRTTYPAESGLQYGTIFPELNKPFLGGGMMK